MRLLIAGTDRSYLKVFQTYLVDRGYQAETAADGLECSASLHRDAPDVLIIDRDLHWGGCEGVLAKMQSDTMLAQIPVVVLMENSTDEHERLLNPSIVAWLQKSIPLRDSLNHITFALSMFRPEGDLVRKSPSRSHSLSQ